MQTWPRDPPELQTWFVIECNKLSNKPANELNTVTEESSSEIDCRFLIELSPPHWIHLHVIEFIKSHHWRLPRVSPIQSTHLCSSLFPVNRACEFLISPMCARLIAPTCPPPQVHPPSIDTLVTFGDDDKLWTSLCNLTYPSVSLLPLLLQRRTWTGVKEKCRGCALCQPRHDYLARLIPPHRTA